MAVNDKRGGRTLLASVLLSAPGPIVLGVGLMFGSSTTQTADFVRRTVEFAATLVSWQVYRATAGLERDDGVRVAFERRVDVCVGTAMLVSGLAMGGLAVGGFIHPADRGNVIPALVIAFLGVISNGILAVNYTLSNAKSPNDVLRAQGTMYRAKTLVDGCVCIALAAVLLLADSAARVADLSGSLAVALVLCVNGSGLLVKSWKKAMRHTGL